MIVQGLMLNCLNNTFHSSCYKRNVFEDKDLPMFLVNRNYILGNDWFGVAGTVRTANVTLNSDIVASRTGTCTVDKNYVVNVLKGAASNITCNVM